MSSWKTCTISWRMVWPELGEVAAERQRYPALEEVGDAEEAFGRGKRQDVGLLEVGVRGVHDQRDAGRHRMAELQRQRVVARLGVRQRRGRQVAPRPGSSTGRRAGPSSDPPVELAVLDLVLAEGKELGRAGTAPAAEDQRQARASRVRVDEAATCLAIFRAPSFLDRPDQLALGDPDRGREAAHHLAEHRVGAVEVRLRR